MYWVLNYLSYMKSQEQKIILKYFDCRVLNQKLHAWNFSYAAFSLASDISYILH